MITADDARDMTSGSKQMISKQLDLADTAVRAAAIKGERKAELNFPMDELVKPMTSALQEFGYRVEQNHSRGVEIQW